MKTAETHWWHGRRGEWYVVLQAACSCWFCAGREPGTAVPPGIPGLRPSAPSWASYFLLAGSLLAAAGAIHLGTNLTPFPRPKEDGRLVTTGAYRLVRHPIYSGLVFMAFGWSLRVHSWLTIGYAVLLFAFLDLKSRREELWLSEKFPAYSAYRAHVRKLIPFIY